MMLNLDTDLSSPWCCLFLSWPSCKVYQEIGGFRGSNPTGLGGPCQHEGQKKTRIISAQGWKSMLFNPSNKHQLTLLVTRPPELAGRIPKVGGAIPQPQRYFLDHPWS